MAGKIQELNESLVIRSLRRFRDRYLPNSGKVKDKLTSGDTVTEEREPGLLDSLPVRHLTITNTDFNIRALLMYQLSK